MYKETELNKTLPVLLIIGSIIIALLINHLVGLLIALSVNLLIAVVFYSMTIEVKDKKLSWHFGLGFFRKQLSVSDIAEASAYQSTWYQGIGIRLLKDGWLYNASVGSAVKLTLKNGKNIYLGCKDVDALLQALKR